MHRGELSQHSHRQHLELWTRREATDRLHSSGRLTLDKHKDPSKFLRELAADPTGFAFGGVYPGTLHAHGKIFDSHRVSYSIGRAGTYRLHVNLHREQTPLPGSPFKLQVLPGLEASASTSFITYSAGADSPSRLARGKSGRRSDAGCTMMLRSCDEMGNFCINGGSKITCMSPLAPQLTVECTDLGNGSYQIEWRAPARTEACSYDVEVSMGGVPVMGSPVRVVMEGAPNDPGASVPDHWWMGITIEGLRLFVQRELCFPIFGSGYLSSLDDAYDSRYVRNEGAMGWVTEQYGQPHEHYRSSNLTGYDLCAAICGWLQSQGYEDRSVLEVLTERPEWREYIGRANVFYSHADGASIGHTLDYMERGCDLYSTELPKDRDGKTYFWLDYVTLRQCQCCPSPHAPPGWPNPRDFDLKSVNALIKEVGFTMAELGARPLRYLTSAFCLYESFSALPTPTKPTSARGFSHDDEKTRKKRDRKQQAALVAKRKAAAEKAVKEKKEKELADKNAKAKQRESSRKKAADSSNSPSPTKATTPSDKSGGSKKQATHLLSGDELKASVKARKRGKDGKDGDDDHGEEEEVLTFRNEKVFAIVDFVRAAAISTLNISGPQEQQFGKSAKDAPTVELPVHCMAARAICPEDKSQIDSSYDEVIGLSHASKYISEAVKEAAGVVIEKLSGQTAMNLARCELAAEHAEPLATLLRKNNKIADLNLAGNRVTWPGVKTLCEALNREPTEEEKRAHMPQSPDGRGSSPTRGGGFYRTAEDIAALSSGADPGAKSSGSPTKTDAPASPSKDDADAEAKAKRMKALRLH